MSRPMSEVKLLPCPCGADAMIHQTGESAGPKEKLVAACRDPECSWSMTGYGADQVATRWNRRAAPPSAPVGVEGDAVKLADEIDAILLQLANGEIKPGKIPLAPWKRAADMLRTLAQQPAAEFSNDGNSEADFIAHHADACTACGGSGHKADQQPAAVDEEMAERFCRRWYEITGRSLERAHVLSSLDTALATQHQEPTT